MMNFHKRFYNDGIPKRYSTFNYISSGGVMSKYKSIKIIVKRKYTGDKNMEQTFSEVIIRGLLKESKELKELKGA
jgi:hypothetical protein